MSHIIRRNASGAVPALRVYVDTEAVRTAVDAEHERQTLWFGWACRELVQARRTKVGTYEEWYRFTTVEQFFRWLEAQTREKSTCYVYAHNWSYDAAILALQTVSAEAGWETDEYVTAHHILWITMHKGKRRLCFIDTLNYFATALATLGEQIGWQKLSMPDIAATPFEWDEYCKNDVALIRYAMNQYFEMLQHHDLGKYRKTAASQAFGTWRHRFMHHDVYVLADPEIEELERAAYHGGRVEVFYDLPITETVFGLDVNSMFPAMMYTHMFPTRKALQGKHAGIDEIQVLLDRHALIAEVELSTDEPVYPVKLNDRLTFPIGHFRTTLSTPELRYALEHHHIVSIGRWVAYEQAPIFAEYVDFFYELRRQYKIEENFAFAYLCKLLLNSLYGKFGQRGMYWDTCPEPDPSDMAEWVGQCAPDMPFLNHRRRFGIIQHQLVDGESSDSFPAIAAHVTAYARMHLWRLMEQTGQRNVYYCDTDSLYTNAEGYIALSEELDNLLLGKLKLERRYAGIHFYAPKDYHWLDGYKAKGIRATAERVTAEQYAERFPEKRRTIAALRSGEYVCFRQVQFESYNSVLNRGVDGEVIVSTVYKVLTRLNLQSQGNGVGWRTPITLSLG